MKQKQLVICHCGRIAEQADYNVPGIFYCQECCNLTIFDRMGSRFAIKDKRPTGKEAMEIFLKNKK